MGAGATFRILMQYEGETPLTRGYQLDVDW